MEQRDPNLSQKQRALDFVYDSIVTGELAPGERVSEKALARKLGCSIIPVREALSHLISVGVFYKVPHNGTFARELTIDEMMAHADFRLMSYTYAVGRAAANPDPAGLAELKTALRDFDEHVRASLARDFSSESSVSWLENLTGIIRRLLGIYRAMVAAAGMRFEASSYLHGDLLYILATRSVWGRLPHASMIEFVQEVFVDYPIGVFLPAIEARDSAAAQQLHYDQHQATTLNVMKRLAAAGVHFPTTGLASSRLRGVSFEFETVPPSRA